MTERNPVRLFFAVLLFLASVRPGSANILMRPYLQALTPTSVEVLVESDVPGTMTVEYGTTPDCGLAAKTESVALTTASPVTYVHRIPLRGLAPGTEYYYRAGKGDAFTLLSRFRTGVLPGTPFRFTWVADVRDGPDIFDSVMVRAAAARPLIGLYGGDLCVRPGYAEWKSGFFRPPQVDFGASVPWVNTPGNHEKWTTNTQAFTHGPAESATQEYFSFDCGDLHVLVLNSEIPLGPGSAQYAFAESDLRGSNRRWKAVMLHKPGYCAGGHGEDPSVITLISGVFEKSGVDIVLSGHSHFYQHNVVNGIHHMVIGSAGAPLYDTARAWYTQKSVQEHNWAVGDVTPSSLMLSVYNEHGAPLDTLILKK
jgi:hypothetical protein